MLADTTNQEGYTDIVSYGEDFFATGTDGRIDRISQSGNIIKSEKIKGEKFNCLLSTGQEIIVGGDRGSLLISSGLEPFRKIDSGTNENINTLALFRNKIIVGADGGQILVGDEGGEFRSITPGLKGNVVSVSARADECFGVTDAGEVIRSTNGNNWSIFDFNKNYQGFYPRCSFVKIVVSDDQIAVIGREENGAPVLMFSNQGNVWTERTLNFTGNEGQMLYLEETLNDIAYDNSNNQLILACSSGKIMTIPSCSHCNELFEVASVDIIAIAISEKKLIVAGENYFIRVLNPGW